MPVTLVWREAPATCAGTESATAHVSTAANASTVLHGRKGGFTKILDSQPVILALFDLAELQDLVIVVASPFLT